MTGSPPSSRSGGLPLGLTGATAATRYVGGTASGAPASGTFAAGDFVIAADGAVFVCTVAGSPGTWAQAGGGATPTLAQVLAAGAAANAKITNLTNGAAAQDAAAFGQIPTLLDNLSDVVIASALGGQRLTYDGTNWINSSEPGLVDAFTPAGAVVQSLGRVQAGTAITLTSQQLQLYGIWLPKGRVITTVTFMSNATALVSGSNQLFGIFDDNAGSSSGTARALLRGTADDTSTAWAANAYKTLALTATYTPTRSGLHYLGILVNAVTPPSLTGTTATSNGTQAALDPAIGGTSTGTITALPNPAAAISANSRLAHAYVS